MLEALGLLNNPPCRNDVSAKADSATLHATYDSSRHYADGNGNEVKKSGNEEENPLSELERLREANMRRNRHMLLELGFVDVELENEEQKRAKKEDKTTADVLQSDEDSESDDATCVSMEGKKLRRVVRTNRKWGESAKPIYPMLPDSFASNANLPMMLRFCIQYIKFSNRACRYCTFLNMPSLSSCKVCERPWEPTADDIALSATSSAAKRFKVKHVDGYDLVPVEKHSNACSGQTDGPLSAPSSSTLCLSMSPLSLCLSSPSMPSCHQIVSNIDDSKLVPLYRMQRTTVDKNSFDDDDAYHPDFDNGIIPYTSPLQRVEEKTSIEVSNSILSMFEEADEEWIDDFRILAFSS